MGLQISAQEQEAIFEMLQADALREKDGEDFAAASRFMYEVKS